MNIKAFAQRHTRLGSNLLWITAGNLLSGFCQWAVLVVVAKLGSLEMVGTFTLGVAICMPVLMLTSLQLRSLQITDVAREYRFVEYFLLRIAATVISVLVIIAIAVGLRPPDGTLIPILLISAAKCFEALSDVFYGYFQQRELMDRIATSMMLRSTLSLVSLGGTLYVTRSLSWAAAAAAFSSALTLLTYDIPASLKLRQVTWLQCARMTIRYAMQILSANRAGRALAPRRRTSWMPGNIDECSLGRDENRIDLSRLAALIWVGAPLGVVVMLVSMNLNIPRYFIEHRLGLGELGIFSSVTNLMAPGNLIINALGQCIAPGMANHFAARNLKAFRTLYSRLVLASAALGAAGVLAAIVVGPRALAIIYSPEFSARPEVLVVLMAAGGFLYIGSSIGFGMTAVRCFKPQLPLFAAGSIVTALGCAMLLRPYGLTGVAVAVLVSAILQCIGGAWLLEAACVRGPVDNREPLVLTVLSVPDVSVND